MNTIENKTITVATTVQAPLEKVWTIWTGPEHIVNWNNASPDWHTPRAQIDLRPGGRFSYRMEARDGSFGFDFAGEYTAVQPHERIEYRMDDGRKAIVRFSAEGNATQVEETFEAESTNPVDLQRQGWQAILDNFKRYAEQAS